jgi:DNA-binding response OmpR family regulator
LILEIGLPDGDGRDFCVKLRRQGHGMPILILEHGSFRLTCIRHR